MQVLILYYWIILKGNSMQYMVSLLSIVASAEHFNLKFTFSKNQKTASPFPNAP